MDTFIKDYRFHFREFLWLTPQVVIAAWMAKAGPFLWLTATCFAISAIFNIFSTQIYRTKPKHETFYFCCLFLLWLIVQCVVVLNLFK